MRYIAAVVRTVLLTSACVAVAFAFPASAQVSLFKPKEKPIEVPEGKRFIDLLGDTVLLPVEQDMVLRFRDGKRYDPQNAITLNDPVLRGHMDAMNIIRDNLLANYNRGPKPPNLPIRIVEAEEVNFMVHYLSDEEEGKTVTNNNSSDGLFGGLLSTKPKSPAEGSEAPTLPFRVEVRATRLGLDAIDDDNELAFLTAHEIAHVLLGHWEVEEARLRRQKKLDDFLRVGVTVVALVNSRAQQRGGNLTFTTDRQAFAEDASKIILVAFVASEYNKVIRTPKWKKEQERQADLLALDLMYNAGYSRTGALTILDKFDKAEAEMEKNREPFFDRLLSSLAMQALMRAANGEDSNNIITSIATQGGLAIYQNFRSSRMAKVHDDSAQRAKVIDAYELAHPEPSPVSLTGVNFFKAHPFKDVSKGVIETMDLIKEMAAVKCGELSSESKALLADFKVRKVLGQRENLALAHEQICIANWDGALNYARAAVTGPEKSSVNYITLATILLEKKDYVEVMNVLDEAESETWPKTQYLPFRVEALLGQNDAAGAEAMALKCKAEAERSIGQSCMLLIGKTYDGEVIPLANGDETTESTKSLWDAIKLQ